MRSLFIFLLLTSSLYGQIKNSGPEPLIKVVYHGYDNPLEFSSDPYFPVFRTVCSNCTMYQIDSVWHLKPGLTGVACTLKVYEAKKPRLLGVYILPFSKLPEPKVYLGAVENGGTLNGGEEVLVFRHDASLQLKGLAYTILSYQLFIEGNVPSWVYPGDRLDERELKQIELKLKDGIKSKIRIVLQVKDRNGVISNQGAFFYL
jgi:hypothetical protein